MFIAIVFESAGIAHINVGVLQRKQGEDNQIDALENEMESQLMLQVWPAPLLVVSSLFSTL